MIGLLLAGATASAKAPTRQGRVCDGNSKCDAGLACVAHAGGKSTCPIVCTPGNVSSAPAQTKCPEHQRCVKDGEQMVCRPVTDLSL